jgi:bifunctional DNase/RNase
MLSDGVRKLPILIGPFEAAAISFALNDEQPDRPLTHDLLRNMVERLGGEVTQVLIDDMWSGTFYAKVFVRHQREDIMFDARPSDAIALAVRTGAPVFVAEGILEHHGR